MTADIYVSLSGQVALDQRLTTVANNIANMATAGFRAEEVHFEAILSSFGNEATAFATEGGTYISRQPGGVMPTGNPLDVAVDGDGWFGFNLPDGGVAYTRDGRFGLTPEGDLVTATGYPVLDAGGAPIALNPNGGPIDIGGDGTIVQDGDQLGVLGLFLIPETATLERYSDAAILTDQEAVPAVDLVANRVRQGFLERSNVDPVLELTRLITIQRTFDSAQTALDTRNGSLRNAIRDLGPAG